jgi:hypothetical protein
MPPSAQRGAGQGGRGVSLPSAFDGRDLAHANKRIRYHIMEKLIQQLEAAWDEDGFFENLRAGIFVESDALGFLSLLRSIEIDQELVPARLLALIWYIPSFLEWQRERVSEVGGDAVRYVRFINEVMNILEEVIGVP